MSKVDDFMNNEAKGTKIIGAKSLEEVAANLKKPRRVMLLVKAGLAVEDFIQKLVKKSYFTEILLVSKSKVKVKIYLKSEIITD